MSYKGYSTLLDAARFRVCRGYTTSLGDGGDEVVSFFATRGEALAAARAEVATLRRINRNGLVITDEVMVEEIDAEGEPMGQPFFWVKADEVIASAEDRK